MTIKHLISSRYTIFHTREGGYSDAKNDLLCYEIITFGFGCFSLVVGWVESPWRFLFRQYSVVTAYGIPKMPSPVIKRVSDY